MIDAQARSAALAPVRARMLRRATDQAAGILADARREADAIVSQARRSAEAAVAHAQAAGSQEAAAPAAAERGRGRREARSLLLSAQREAHDELHSQVRAAVGRLRREPGYGQLLDRLTRMARLAAGPNAELTVSPDGGAVARSGGVVVDCSLPRLADLAVQALGPDVRELWTP
ncbi:MAG TPA: V-type ATP synthase subunit E family protein [Streptosporangiaceae bacterium]|nr:V-type ATP synthase subunit E family protein [Streptosporangiaceae bacterium]